MTVRFTREALAHIVSIRAYIGARSPHAAAHVVELIFAEADRLGEFPHLGHPGQVVGTRERTVPRLPYIILHQHGVGNEVIILGVFHGAQDR